MSTNPITWYSTDKRLSTVDQGPISKQEALKIVENYFARLKPTYESAEEALAETMFGFQRSKSEFIELCINGPAEISLKYEASVPRKVLFLNLPDLIQEEWTLGSKQEVEEEVAAFFDLDSAAYRSHASSQEYAARRT